MTDLAPRQPDATPAVYDAATLAVLHAVRNPGDHSTLWLINDSYPI